MDPARGGPSQGIRNSIPLLEQMQIDNEVVCLDEPDAPFLAGDTFIVHALGQAKGPWAYHEELVPWLMHHLERFDVVIVHGLWQYHGRAVYKAFIQYKKLKPSMTVPKLYVMPHGMLDPYFQRASGRKFKALRNWIYWKLVERQLVEIADGLLFTTEEELQLAKTTFRPYKPRQEVNIGYGIKKAPAYQPVMKVAFQEKCKGWNNEKYLLFLSRVHEKKGIDMLIEAYIKLKEEGNVLPLLVIAGPGLDTPFGKKIQQKALRHKDVLFAGMLTGDAKWGSFYHCEAFILPSHQENFGIAVTEALACSKPVLITNQVNIWREIEAAKAGLIEDDTLEGTINLIGKWNGLEIEAKNEMAANAVNCFQRSFSIEEAVLKMTHQLKLSISQDIR